jgi:uncharacterized metal-binding protein YceD (DUF177 family)
MCSLESFKIDLKGLKEDNTVLEYSLDDNYFEAIDAPEVKNGIVNVSLSIRRTSSFFDFIFNIKGTIRVTCDRCLDDMNQEIDAENKLVVKYGEEYSEDDDLVTIPENDGTIDVAWFIYQFIVLNIPIQHVHAPGKCNPAMIDLLNKHLATRSGDRDDDDTVDPRWSELEKLKNNIKD